MNEEEKPKKTFRSEAAFIASLITIFAFVTGINSLDITGPKPSSAPEPSQTPVISTAEPTHTPVVTVSPATPPVTQAPKVEITPASTKPGPHDLDGQDGVASPTNGWLTDYETKSVEGTTSGNAYLRWSPSKEGREYNRYISEGEIVTVLAMENGYSLVKTSDGRAGWVTSNLLK